jgi:hypothetical protein
MRQIRKIIVPRVFCFSNFREPAIKAPGFKVEVDGYFSKKDIVISSEDGSRIRVSYTNEIFSNGVSVGRVDFPNNVYQTGKTIVAKFKADVFALKIARNFPKYSARRIYYEVLHNEIKIGYLIAATNETTKVIIGISDDYEANSWFFGYSAVRVRMSFVSE